jgi:dolichyl-phosphate beta-glucosyltransferase
MEISETHRPKLSVILPSLNEESRIGVTLQDAVAVFRDRYASDWELIVVDDGSRDQTVAVVREFAADCPELVLISHPKNLGKGAAVRTGVLASRGELVLYADADNATPFSQYHSLLTGLERGADVACGSRFGNDPGQVRRTLSRRIIAAFFATLAKLLVNPGVSDTQCGFKLFQQSSEDGYLFDLEILGLAALCGIPVAEIPVAWREIPGSSVRLVRDSWRMFVGLFRLRKILRQQSLLCSQWSAADQTQLPDTLLRRNRTDDEFNLLNTQSQIAQSMSAEAMR